MVASEGFNYGSTGGALAGKSGGAGFAGGWSTSNSFTYVPAGLTFGSLPTQGGAAAFSSPASGSTNTERPFAATLSGTTWGTYLFRIDSRSGTFNNLGLLLASTSGQSDANAPLAISLPLNSSTTSGRVMIQFLDAAGAQNTVSGAAQQLGVGTTYMALFKIVPGSSAATANLWLLTSNQYDLLAAGGVTEAELNAATIGSGDANVWGRASVTANLTLNSRAYLSLFGFTGSGSLAQTVDEVRLSNSSLAEAAVPEPGATTFALGAALAVVGTARRRKRAGRAAARLAAGHPVNESR
ncbi:MAG TPA: hypothetical protein VF796_11730 [Humisphaera sp.]